MAFPLKLAVALLVLVKFCKADINYLTQTPYTRIISTIVTPAVDYGTYSIDHLCEYRPILAISLPACKLASSTSVQVLSGNESRIFGDLFGKAYLNDPFIVTPKNGIETKYPGIKVDSIAKVPVTTGVINTKDLLCSHGSRASRYCQFDSEYNMAFYFNLPTDKRMSSTMVFGNTRMTLGYKGVHNHDKVRRLLNPIWNKNECIKVCEEYSQEPNLRFLEDSPGKNCDIQRTDCEVPLESLVIEGICLSQLMLAGLVQVRLTGDFTSTLPLLKLEDLEYPQAEVHACHYLYQNGKGNTNEITTPVPKMEFNMSWLVPENQKSFLNDLLKNKGTDEIDTLQRRIRGIPGMLTLWLVLITIFTAIGFVVLIAVIFHLCFESARQRDVRRIDDQNVVV